jgi:hypothetical protein
MEKNESEGPQKKEKQYYEPPEQGTVGQIFDSVIIFIIIYCVLLLPLVLGLTAGVTTTTEIPEAVTWEILEQNEVMQAQWAKIGIGPKEAAEYILTKFDYTINPLSLIFTAIVVVGYFVIVLRFSDREYKDVISEKFD